MTSTQSGEYEKEKDDRVTGSTDLTGSDHKGDCDGNV